MSNPFRQRDDKRREEEKRAQPSAEFADPDFDDSNATSRPRPHASSGHPSARRGDDRRRRSRSLSPRNHNPPSSHGKGVASPEAFGSPSLDTTFESGRSPFLSSSVVRRPSTHGTNAVHPYNSTIPGPSYTSSKSSAPRLQSGSDTGDRVGGDKTDAEILRQQPTDNSVKTIFSGMPPEFGPDKFLRTCTKLSPSQKVAVNAAIYTIKNWMYEEGGLISHDMIRKRVGIAMTKNSTHRTVLRTLTEDYLILELYRTPGKFRSRLIWRLFDTELNSPPVAFKQQALKSWVMNQGKSIGLEKAREYVLEQANVAGLTSDQKSSITTHDMDMFRDEDKDFEKRLLRSKIRHKLSKKKDDVKSQRSSALCACWVEDGRQKCGAHYEAPPPTK